jgi:hypothetical protein
MVHIIATMLERYNFKLRNALQRMSKKNSVLVLAVLRVHRGFIISKVFI